MLDGVEVNRNVLNTGAALISNGSINDEGTLYTFDLLVRKRGDSVLGNFHYLPALVYGGYSNPPNLRQILSLTGSKLAPLQRLPPKHGLVINASFERATRTIALPSKPSEIKKILLGIEALRSEPPRLQLNSHCAICEYRLRCEAIAKQEDNLSLLKGLKPKAITKLARRGIFTVSQYSHTYRARRSHGGPAGAPRQHALQAMAIRDQKLYLIGRPEVPVVDTSVYLDFEGDPERGLVYLIGALVSRQGVTTHHSFWADSHNDVPGMLDDLHQLLVSLGSFCAFSYGSYESACLRSLALHDKGKKLFELIQPRLTNVLSIIYKHVYFPVYSNGLKEIAAALGFKWRSANASGLQSIVWRRRWEATKDSELKLKVIGYNEDDCLALQVVTQTILSIARQESQGLPWPHECQEKLRTQFSTPTWDTAEFHLSQFEFINKRAYFDYQRDHVFLRPGKKRRSKKQPRTTLLYKVRPTELRQLTEEKCPHCNQDGIERRELCQRTKVQYDLKVRRSGIARIVRFCRAYRYYCHHCKVSFRSDRFRRVKRYGHAIQCWAALQNVEYHVSFANVAGLVREAFGIPMHKANAHHAKTELAAVYYPLFHDSLKRILEGNLIHADETEIRVKGDTKAYVWVLSNMNEAVYIFRETRETAFLQELLRDFRGVLVSDFYVGYDSITCEQQRCLIHLMRDINQSIRLAPFDMELREIAEWFGSLLKSIVTAVDEFGLRATKLSRFKKSVTNFFDQLDAKVYLSEVAEDFRLRLLRNRARLFTFIDHDQIPWNNNNAEHAMKPVSRFREETRSLHTVSSIKNHLLLLGIYVTCQYRGISFFKFLLSRKLSFAPNSPKVDDDWFDLYPIGYQNPRRKSRKPTPNPTSSSLPIIES